MYWYVVVSGTLEMFNVDSRHDKKVGEREKERKWKGSTEV